MRVDTKTEREDGGQTQTDLKNRCRNKRGKRPVHSGHRNRRDLYATYRSVLMINTKIWFAYPMSYPFYLLMIAYGRAAEGVYDTQIAWLPWLPVAIGITVFSLAISCARYGASERR